MLGQLFKTFINSIFPVKCQACGVFFHPKKDSARGKDSAPHLSHDPIEIIFYQVMEPFLCPSCTREFSPVSPPFCTRCGRMFETGTGKNHLCGFCIQNKPACHRIRAAGIYDGALKSSIHELKYNDKIQLARPLGRLLFSGFMQYYDDLNIDCIVPIPLHGSRLKQRGFNQAELLIDEWPMLAKNYRVTRSILLNGKNLIRNRKTKSQTGLGKEKRKLNVKNAFSVSDASEVSGKQILLVDDVYTTGSTAEECAKTLIAAGAKTVSVLTLARAE